MQQCGGAWGVLPVSALCRHSRAAETMVSFWKGTVHVVAWKFAWDGWSCVEEMGCLIVGGGNGVAA